MVPRTTPVTTTTERPVPGVTCGPRDRPSVVRSQRNAAGMGSWRTFDRLGSAGTAILRRAAMTDLHIPASPVSPAPQARGGDSSLTLDDSVFNRLLKERIIFLGSEVNDQVANRICAQMLLLAAEDEERDIWLYINSPGGSVTALTAL